MWYTLFYIRRHIEPRSMIMARDFTPEELEEIRKSAEFEKYVNAQGSNQESQTLLNNYIQQYGEQLEIQFNTSDIIEGKVTSVKDDGDIYRIVLEDGVNRAVFKSPLEENNYIPAVGDNWSLRSSGKHFGAADNLSLRVNGNLVYSKSQNEMDNLDELNRAKTLQVMHNIEVLKEAFAKTAAEFEYDKEGSVKEFIAEKEKLFNSARPIDLEYVEGEISDWMKQDMIPYGGTAVAIPEEMKQMYQKLSVSQKNTSKLDDRQNNNDSTAEVPDLSRLDEAGLTGLTTAELVAMLRDPNYAGGDNEQFRLEVADLFEKYHIGKTANEAEFKAKMRELQERHTLAENKAIENFVSPRTARNLPPISLKLVPGPAPRTETHLEDREVPDLSQLILHMRGRNDSMTVSILQERLDDIRANRPNDTRAIEIYENVINAYRSGAGIDKLNDLIKTEEDAAVAEDIAKEVEYDNAYNVPRPTRKIIVPGPAPRPQPGPNPITLDGVLMRGWNADEWQQLIDGQNTEFLNAIEFMEGVEVTALKAIGKLPDNFGDMTPDERRAVIENLTPVEMAKFNGAMNAASQKILETYPPKFMVFLHRRIGEELKIEEAKKDKDAQTIEMLKEQHSQINEAMIKKLDAYVKGDLVVDQSNIADVYDGASEMFAYLKEQNKDSAVIAKAADEAQKKLDAEIKIYDEANGFDKVSPKDAAAIEKAFEKTSKMADELKPEDYPEIQQMIDGLEFESDEDKKIFTDIVRQEAARRAAVKGFGDKDEDLKAKFAEAFKEAATVNVGSLLTANELLKFDGKTNPKDIDPKVLEANVAQAVENLKSGKKVKIAKNAVMAHAANAVNSAAGWLNRLAHPQKLGNKAPVLKKVYDKISHLDKTCIKRFGPAFTALRSYKKAVGQNMLSQLVNQGARYGINGACMLLGQPGLGAPLYATFYAGQAAFRLYRQYDLEKKANGGKINGWKFLGRHLPEIAQTALITSATLIGGVWGGKAVEALGHALPLDRCLSYAGMAVGGVTSLVKGYRASRKEGNSVWKSLRKSLGNTALSTGTALACGYGIGAGINQLDTGLHSAGLFGEHMTKDITADEYNQHADDTLHYNKEAIASAEDTARYAEMTPEQLNEAGITVDGIDKATAEKMIGLSDEQLAERGIVRSETTAEDPNGVKVIDTPAGISITYPDNFAENAKEIMSLWTKDVPGLLEDNVSALNSIIAETKADLLTQGISREIDPYRILMIAGDCGAQMVNADVDTNMNHVDLQQKYDCNLPQNTLSHMQANGEDMEPCHGKHTVLGSGWCQQHGFSEDEIKAVAEITDADGKIIPEKLTPDVMKTILALDMGTSEHNEVGHVNKAPIHTDGVLERNAAMVDGKYTHAEAGKGQIYTTYANAQGMNIDNIEEKAHFERLDQLSKVEMQQEIPMTTTFDRFWGKIKSVCLLGRAGSNGKSKEQENDIRPIRTDDKAKPSDRIDQNDARVSQTDTAKVDKKDDVQVDKQDGDKSDDTVRDDTSRKKVSSPSPRFIDKSARVRAWKQSQGLNH